MSITPERTLHIGDTDDVWGRITETTGQDITSLALTLRVVAPDGTVGGWAAPQADDRTAAATGLIRASVRVTPTVEGRHTVQAKLTPTGRVVILTVGTFNVITP